MNSNQNIEDLKHIRNLMERSSKFLSLSGFSGISAGVCALIGASVAWFILFDRGTVKYDEHIRALGSGTTFGIRLKMALLAGIVLVGAACSALYFSSRKAKCLGSRLWTSTAKRTLYQFMVPLVAGGLFCIALAVNNNIHLIASAMLVFYGLSLINASKFTVSEIHYLGIFEVILGIFAGFFLDHGLLFWTLGFGVLHVIYGIRIYWRYDRKIPTNK